MIKKDDHQLRVKNFKNYLKEQREELNEGTMTRQHFELIAKVIKNLPQNPSHRQVATRFAKELQSTNTGFNETTFMNACGYHND